MDFFATLTWADLLVVLLLAVGALAGFTQGLLHYLLATLGVIVAFVVASLLKHSATDVLAFWTAYTEPVREMILFLVLYLLLLAGLWFAIRVVTRGARMPGPRQLNQIGGAVFGILFAATALVFFMVILESLYRVPGPGVEAAVDQGEASLLRNLYVDLDRSRLLGSLRAAIAPTAGLLVRPFVSEEIRGLLQPR